MILEHSIFNIEFWTLNIEYWILNIEYWILNNEYRILNIEYWILNIEYWISNIEYWKLDIEYWILNIEHWIIPSFHVRRPWPSSMPKVTPMSPWGRLKVHDHRPCPRSLEYRLKVASISLIFFTFLMRFEDLIFYWQTHKTQTWALLQQTTVRLFLRFNR